MKEKKIPWLRIGGVILGILGAWMCISGASMYRHFVDMEPVVLDAVVERIVESYDADYGTSYDYHVSYTYEDRTYTTLYERTNSPYYAEGDTVRIVVDKDNPQNMVSAVEGNAMAMGLFGSLFVGLGAMTIPVHCTPKAEGLYVKPITAKVAGRIRYRLLLIAPALTVLVFMNCNPRLVAVGAVVLSLGVLDTVRFVRDLLAAVNGRLVLQKDAVIGQRMRNSENALFCTLKLSGRRKYSYQIAKTVYSTYVKNETVTAIYLTGRKPEALADIQSEQIV